MSVVPVCGRPPARGLPGPSPAEHAHVASRSSPPGAGLPPDGGGRRASRLLQGLRRFGPEAQALPARRRRGQFRSGSGVPRGTRPHRQGAFEVSCQGTRRPLRRDVRRGAESEGTADNFGPGSTEGRFSDKTALQEQASSSEAATARFLPTEL